MDPVLWHERWQQGRIGFHLDEVNPCLRRHWARLGVAAPARVFVPLAGKSVDLPWFEQQGYQVVANEISPIAVEAFFREQGLQPQVSEVHDTMQCWQARNITLFCGDFMDLTPEDVGAVDAVYDRAALIALTAQQRPAYARQLLRLAGRVPQLLITLEYDRNAMNGPPYAVAGQEVRDYYQAGFRIEEAERRDILAHSPKFRAKGLESLEEVVYRLLPG